MLPVSDKVIVSYPTSYSSQKDRDSATSCTSLGRIGASKFVCQKPGFFKSRASPILFHEIPATPTHLRHSNMPGKNDSHLA